MIDRNLGMKTVASARSVFFSGLKLEVVSRRRIGVVALGWKVAADASSSFVGRVDSKEASRAVAGTNSGAVTAATKGDE